MKLTPAVSVLGCLALLMGSHGAAQPSAPNSPRKASGTIAPAKIEQAAANAGCLPTVAALKRIANDAWTASHDRDRVLAAVDEAIGPDAEDPWVFVDHADDGLLFTVAFPARQFRFSLSEVMRKREPITEASASSAVLIDVRATRIDSANIEKVIVERNGKVIPPLSNSLAPHVMTTRLGAKEVINSGRLTYPCSAFFPGAEVTVTGIPSGGHNLVLTLNDDQLEVLSGREFPRPLRAAGLVGLPEDRVRKLLGETATQTPERLGYDTNNGDRLLLTTKGGRIVAVSNEKLLIADIRPPTKIASPATIEAPPETPKGAVAKCGDGQFVLRGDGGAMGASSSTASRQADRCRWI
jgi:hypothetical protein